MGVPASRARAQKLEEARFAIDMHVMSYPQTEIAKAMTLHFGRHFSQPVVSRRIREACDTYLLPDLEALKRVELARLDALYERLVPRLQDGVPAAVQQALAIMDRRSRYLGLDAVVKTEVAVSVQVGVSVSEELSQLSEALGLAWEAPKELEVLDAEVVEAEPPVNAGLSVVGSAAGKKDHHAK